MLIGLDPLLSGDLLQVLRDMGHGDRICIADCNFPAHEIARRAGIPLIPLATDLPTATRGVLSVMPLDSFIEHPVRRMADDNAPAVLNEAHREVLETVHRTAGERWQMGSLERFAFYAEAASCAAVVATLDRRGYANVILTKGVIGADNEVV
jgi:L-fucose mutarotase